MKKCFLACMIASMAVSIFGATIAWTSGTGLKLPDADGSFSSSSLSTKGYFQYWLVTQATYNTFDAYDDQEFYQAIKVDNAFDAPASYIETSGGGKTSATKGAAWASTTVFEKGDCGYVVGLVEYTDVDTGKKYFITMKGYDQINDLGAPSKLASQNLAKRASAWATPVPEPTSLALLAFGLIAVGARRKIA